MHENIVRIKAVHNLLKDLNQRFVFVGGATVSLYSSNLNVITNVRPTEDVDIVVEISTLGDYTLFEDRLRSIGFFNDIESGVICRYRKDGFIVDFMPTNPNVLGFSNI